MMQWWDPVGGCIPKAANVAAAATASAAAAAVAAAQRTQSTETKLVAKLSKRKTEL